MSRAVMLPGFGASRRRCRAISANPDDMLRGDIDLLGTVLEDLDKYRGDERVDIRGVPAYVVFADKALVEMAHRRPRNADEFAEINGVGAAKLRDFAEPFLAVIAADD